MKKIIFSCFIVAYGFVAAQTELVFVYFKDKPNKAAFYSNPLSELSQKSLDRRANLGIALNDQDAPIEPSYVTNIANLGYTVTDYSKWLNGVAVDATSDQIAELSTLPYVASVEKFAKTGKMTSTGKKFEKFEPINLRDGKTSFNYGTGAAQIDQVNLRALHVAGFTGSGMSIAVIDTGFPTVNTGSAYSRLRNNGLIKGVYNFVNKSTDVYDTSLHPHGSVVLGAIGGYFDGSFVGSAPDANFYLYATEDGYNEIPEEQLYWIEAAEEADRKGVDVITASLGYSTFDDPRYNMTYADMNGTTSFIARGAQIATEKGIFVLAANGNEANNSWHYVLTPADNQYVFSIGAVDSSGNSSSFSSYGPNSDGVIKPDGSARGSNTATVYSNTTYSASGTSLATPVAAGGVVCLLQSLPQNTSRQVVRDQLRQTASLYPNYTDQMGYGILNFYQVYDSMVLSTKDNVLSKKAAIYPNPVKDLFMIKTSENIVSAEIYNSLGQLVLRPNISLSTVDGSSLKSGVYFVKIKTDKREYIEKFIKE